MDWYSDNQRDLPWRGEVTPWGIWVSEIMLQQTQVKKVLDYYLPFLDRFPTPQSLAESTEDQALKFWEGMGYYNRLHNLRKAAKEVTHQYRGKIPKLMKDLMALPGVGRSTAGAMVSRIDGTPKPVLDGNVKRVVARRRGSLHSPGRLFEKELWRWVTLAVQLAPDPGEWNQALMELGALVCTPKKPSCHVCPWSHACKGLSLGNPEKIPTASPKKKKIPQFSVSLALLWEGERFWVQRREGKRHLSGLWELPGGKHKFQEDPAVAVQREVFEETGLEMKDPRFLGQVHHQYSHFSVKMWVYEGQAEGQISPSAPYRWIVPEDISQLSFPMGTKKAFALKGWS